MSTSNLTIPVQHSMGIPKKQHIRKNANMSRTLLRDAGTEMTSPKKQSNKMKKQS